MHVPKMHRGEVEFDAVDNPGLWSAYTFRAKFASTRTTDSYLYHQSPTSAQPVPIDPETGKRTVDGWEFFYQGWDDSANNDDTMRRAGATRHNVIPQERQTELDGDLLKKMGLNWHRMVNHDCLFSLQLLLPFHDPEKTGIDDDKCLPYFSLCSKYSNHYAITKLLWGDYGNEFKPTHVKEQVNWHGAIARNQLQNFYHNWDSKKDNHFDKLLHSTFSV